MYMIPYNMRIYQFSNVNFVNFVSVLSSCNNTATTALFNRNTSKAIYIIIHFKLFYIYKIKFIKSIQILLDLED